MASTSNEEHALLSLVQGAAGRRWSASLHGWSSDSGIAVCQWEGVTCRVSLDDAAGHATGGFAAVAEVDLSARQLEGTVPTELGLLEGLERLTLKNNMLQGAIPPEVARLTNLKELDLTGCFLTGTLPQQFASPHLTTLLLADNAISGRFFHTEGSPHLASIEEVRLENNLLTGTLHGRTLSAMPRLDTLSLSANDLSGLLPGEALGALPSLQYLYVDANAFVGPLPPTLAQAGRSRLLELWVQDNALSGTVPAAYVRFDRLHDFFLDGNKLTGALPPDLCGPEINSDFFDNLPPEAERNYCDSIACPAGSVAFEGVYPCERCPGGEASRLKNRYLGQTGHCANHTQRDVLRLFHAATTKGGPWAGVSDWTDEKPVCDMTGVTCDAHDNVVEISLRNRGLEGILPDELGYLSFLEALDVSDNDLMGRLPSDLRWTSLRRLDVSGNRLRGVVPPLLCLMEDVNGNGAAGAFYCDRIACPAGTYGVLGFRHHGSEATCRPCHDGTPFIAQKRCARTAESSGFRFFQMTEQTGEAMGMSTGALVGFLVVLLLTLAIGMCSLVEYFNPRKQYEARHLIQRQGSPYEDEDEDEIDDYSFSAPEFTIADDGHDEDHSGASNDVSSSDDERSYLSRATTRSATQLLNEHRGVALNRRARIQKAMSQRLPGELGRRTREAASSLGASARRMSVQRNRVVHQAEGRESNTQMGDDRFRIDVELVSNNSHASSEDAAPGPSDLLDVPMIT